MARTAAISLRVEPELKAAAEKAAADDRRTVASLVEKILAEWLDAHGYLKGEGSGEKAPPAGRGVAKRGRGREQRSSPG